MAITFTKMHGLGNDFVMIDDMDGSFDLTADEVSQLCDRHFGIGADGVILVQPPREEGHTGYMHYINADGTLAQMCGNGVRCTAAFLIENGYVDADATELTVDTMSGPRRITFTRTPDGRMASATVEMGVPILDPAAIPVDASANAQTPQGADYVREMTVDSPWGPFAFTCVSMGNPHAVCFVDDWSELPGDAFTDASVKGLDTLDVDKVGSFFEAHAIFPEKANIEFAEMLPDKVRMRVYERGCAETLACGTGACAVGVSAALTQGAPDANDVELAGGTLRIQWPGEGEVRMTGPAVRSFSGEVSLPLTGSNADA